MTTEAPHLFTVAATDQPSSKLIEAVGSLVNASPGDLAPLQEIIDPDLLDNVRHSRSDVSFSFEYEGYHVTAHSDGRIVLRDPNSIYAQLDNVSNVLHSTAADDGADCVDLLQQYPFRYENVLNIVYDEQPEQCLNAIARHGPTAPSAAKLIAVGEAALGAPDRATRLEADVVTINELDDFSALGKAIIRTIGEWHPRDEQTVVCFRSIDSVVEHAGTEAGFKFFHLLTEKISSTDVTAHYHLDPNSCDDVVLNTFMPLFDAVVHEEQSFTLSQ